MRGTRAQRTLVITIAVLFMVSVGVRLGLGLGTEPWSILFHGVPAMLAVSLVYWDEATTSFGRLFRAVTIGLLLVSVATGEGTICVLIAAPLVYAVAAVVWGITRQASKLRHHSATLLVIALSLSVFNGAPPPTEITATVVVPLNARQALQRLAEPVGISGPDDGLLARQLPHMVGVSGSGLDVGDERTMEFSDGERVVMRVAERTDASVRLEVVDDTTMTSEWMRWDEATFAVREVPTGTAVTMTVRYELLLDPSWYFAPIVEAGTGDAAGHVLVQLFASD